MCHMNFKNMNKLVKNNLVRGLLAKEFSCDDHCVACLKGKQHKSTHKSKEIYTISSPLQLLHIDLFGPTNVMSIGKKSYCLVIVDDYSRFTWVFFLRIKDETSELIKPFNSQQNGVERRNRTLIEAARSLLADSKLPITFLAEAVNTICYVVLVVRSKGKTPYELLKKNKPFIAQSKAFRVFNSSTRIIEESDNVKCNENTPNIPESSAAQSKSPEENDSNLGVNLQEEPLHLTRKQNKSVGVQNPQLGMLSCFLSQVEPKKTYDSLKDPMDLPNGHREIATKWIFRNKKDEKGIVIKNKARLVAQGYTQEEGIDYDNVFTSVSRIEAIRLLLAFASFKRFKVYQIDVKRAFLYGKIDEEVYVCQPSGFEDPKFPNRVYKLKKALYGLHQASRAWYDTLVEKEVLVVQIYVDDITFGYTKDELCKDIKELMHKKFKMSSMSELTFFLGLQVKQNKDGIFINKSKYVKDMLNKFGYAYAKPASTPMETHK
ncbi:LOW QUALITY PROTEIN: hypothetical protein OSB04_019990 [Centaurea solstitialis]|uniref:Reverse transcriptase Ty1/copia-type domain-containing protein n=1 Tax=Centaurea solstitialis TaxID=347529 RepID=A0AA38W3F8_9ASTR|nr:LOW QUALITY PROTEIN: hypothetical protein OSB04_019990 [Centaurea solstitialis]